MAGRRAPLLAAAAATALASACGGTADRADSPRVATDGGAESAPLGNVPDLGSIGESDVEHWARRADAWASERLDHANTAGELLGDPQSARQAIDGEGRTRMRVLRAARALSSSCENRAALPDAPPGLEDVGRDLTRACRAFVAASRELLPALEARNAAATEAGYRTLTRGVNAVARAYARLGPLLAE